MSSNANKNSVFSDLKIKRAPTTSAHRKTIGLATIALFVVITSCAYWNRTPAAPRIAPAPPPAASSSPCPEGTSACVEDIGAGPNATWQVMLKGAPAKGTADLTQLGRAEELLQTRNVRFSPCNVADPLAPDEFRLGSSLATMMHSDPRQYEDFIMPLAHGVVGSITKMDRKASDAFINRTEGASRLAGARTRVSDAIAQLSLLSESRARSFLDATTRATERYLVLEFFRGAVQSTIHTDDSAHIVSAMQRWAVLPPDARAAQRGAFFRLFDGIHEFQAQEVARLWVSLKQIGEAHHAVPETRNLLPELQDSLNVVARKMFQAEWDRETATLLVAHTSMCMRLRSRHEVDVAVSLIHTNAVIQKEREASVTYKFFEFLKSAEETPLFELRGLWFMLCMEGLYMIGWILCAARFRAHVPCYGAWWSWSSAVCWPIYLSYFLPLTWCTWISALHPIIPIRFAMVLLVLFGDYLSSVVGRFAARWSSTPIVMALPLGSTDPPSKPDPVPSAPPAEIANPYPSLLSFAPPIPQYVPAPPAQPRVCGADYMRRTRSQKETVKCTLPVSTETGMCRFEHTPAS